MGNLLIFAAMCWMSWEGRQLSVWPDDPWKETRGWWHQGGSVGRRWAALLHLGRVSAAAGGLCMGGGTQKDVLLLRLVHQRDVKAAALKHSQMLEVPQSPLTCWTAAYSLGITAGTRLHGQEPFHPLHREHMSEAC